jgi:hypothetical protein
MLVGCGFYLVSVGGGEGVFEWGLPSLPAIADENSLPRIARHTRDADHFVGEPPPPCAK